VKYNYAVLKASVEQHRVSPQQQQMQYQHQHQMRQQRERQMQANDRSVAMECSNIRPFSSSAVAPMLAPAIQPQPFPMSASATFPLLGDMNMNNPSASAAVNSSWVQEAMRRCASILSSRLMSASDLQTETQNQIPSQSQSQSENQTEMSAMNNGTTEQDRHANAENTSAMIDSHENMQMQTMDVSDNYAEEQRTHEVMDVDEERDEENSNEDRRESDMNALTEEVFFGQEEVDWITVFEDSWQSMAMKTNAAFIIDL
jgi:hypothetical protein